MKKWFGIFALAAIIGFMTAACDDGGPIRRQPLPSGPPDGEGFVEPTVQRPPRNWESVDVNDTFGTTLNDRVWAMTAGGGKYVAVGGLLATNVAAIMHASHPEMWERSSGTFQYPIRNVAYGDGRFVAVDYANFVLNITEEQLETSSAFYSTDGGASWTGPIDTGVKGVIGLTYADGKWVAGGFYGTILVSTNGGVTWTQKTEQLFDEYEYSAIRGITYAPDEGRWFVVGDRGRIAYSDDDLESWTIINLPNHANSESLQAIVYHQDGKLLAAGNLGRIYYSEDVGETWILMNSASSGFSTDVYDLTYGNGCFVGVASGGQILYSENEIDRWMAFDPIMPPSPFGGSQSIFAVAYGGGFWIAGGRNGIVAYSNVND